MKFFHKNFFRRKGVRTFLILLVTVTVFSFAFCFYSPQELVEKIGVHNGYVLMFFISLFGGVSAIASGSYLGTLAALAAGGLNPFFLAILSGAGATFGDSMFFFLGKRGRGVMSKNILHKWAKKLNSWLEQKPAWFTPVAIYTMVSFTPIPNDILALTMGFAKKKYSVVVIPLVLGNMTFAFLVAMGIISLF